MDCSMPALPVLHSLLKFALTHVPWVGDAIEPSHPITPFSSCPQSFPASGSFLMSWLFTSGGPSIGASASVFPMNIQDWFQHWLLWSPCSPRKSPEFSPTPQLRSFNSLTLSLPHGPTLTSTHDYWKTHSFDNMDPCLASDFSAF